jgi:hypothetical protein
MRALGLGLGLLRPPLSDGCEDSPYSMDFSDLENSMYAAVISSFAG